MNTQNIGNEGVRLYDSVQARENAKQPAKTALMMLILGIMGIGLFIVGCQKDVVTVEEYLETMYSVQDIQFQELELDREAYRDEVENDTVSVVMELAKSKANYLYNYCAIELSEINNSVPTDEEIMECYYDEGGDQLIYQQIQEDLIDRLFGDIDLYNGPDSLFYTCLESDGCYVTQSDSDHFEANGYLAVDIGTNNKNIGVRVPDYHNHEIDYQVEYKYYPDTTGKTVELYGEYGGTKFMWRIGHVHPEGYENITEAKTGDIVALSGGETELDDQGATTGKHVHIEFLLWDGDKYSPTPYRITNNINIHVPGIDEAVTYDKEYLTTFYLSGYNAGDVSQNDGAPCTSASGEDICKMLNEGKNVIAITADQRSEYGISFGDIVYLKGDTCDGYYYVEDEMAERYREGCETSGTSQGYCIKGDIAFPYGESVRGCVADIYKINY